MSMSPHEMERKVRQLDNDVQSVYELLFAITSTQTRHGNRFDEIAQDLDRHTATLAEHTATLAQHTATLAEHTTRFDRIDERLEGLESSLTEVLRRLPEPGV